MRAFEFYTKKVFENDAVADTPKSIEGAKALNAALDKAIEIVKRKQNVTNKPLAASQIDIQKPVESLDEDIQEYKTLIADAKKDLIALEKLLPPGPESAKVLEGFKLKVVDLER